MAVALVKVCIFFAAMVLLIIIATVAFIWITDPRPQETATPDKEVIIISDSSPPDTKEKKCIYCGNIYLYNYNGFCSGCGAKL